MTGSYAYSDSCKEYQSTNSIGSSIISRNKYLKAPSASKKDIIFHFYMFIFWHLVIQTFLSKILTFIILEIFFLYFVPQFSIEKLFLIYSIFLLHSILGKKLPFCYIRLIRYILEHLIEHFCEFEETEWAAWNERYCWLLVTSPCGIRERKHSRVLLSYWPLQLFYLTFLEIVIRAV